MDQNSPQLLKGTSHTAVSCLIMPASIDQFGKESNLSFIASPKQFKVSKYDTRATPYTVIRKFPEGHKKLEENLPFSCFPEHGNDGKPGTIKVLRPKYIISSFIYPRTVMKTFLYERN